MVPTYLQMLQILLVRWNTANTCENLVKRLRREGVAVRHFCGYIVIV